MKKLLALLMALCMLASITAAFAEVSRKTPRIFRWCGQQAPCPRNSVLILLIRLMTRMS